MIELRTYSTQKKIVKSKRQTKRPSNTYRHLPSLGNTPQGVSKCKNKKCGACNIIIKGKLYTLKKTLTIFKINRTNCKQTYIGCTRPRLDLQKCCLINRIHKLQTNLYRMHKTTTGPPKMLFNK